MLSGRRMAKQVGQRGFATEEALLNRIKAVTNIQKITKAMKMVSAAKMKGDLRRLDAGKEFAHSSVDMIFKCDTYMQRKAAPEESSPKELIVPITSDRGLCGGINSGVIRNVREYVATKNRSDLELFVIGEKGTAAAARPFPDLLKENVQNLCHPINFNVSLALGQKIQTNSHDKDKIVIMYNEFVSAIASEIRRIELMSRSRFMAAMKF
jgi:F-type H+-transporting ATPase subunit gamma